MKIAVGSDSVQHIDSVETCGALAGLMADYVDSGRAVAEKVAAGECNRRRAQTEA